MTDDGPRPVGGPVPRARGTHGSAAGRGDASLVELTRSGDAEAFAELWRRHYRAGIAVARSISPAIDPDDLVQEAFARIYQSIVAGGGPTGSFRAYLFTSIRNTAVSWARARRETTLDDLDEVADPATTEHATMAALDRGLTHQAFRSLPARWQEVLWYSEVEGMRPSEIAPLLGMKPTAVAQLTFRAREGLREAWIQAHLKGVDDGSTCAWAIERLGAYSRDNIGLRGRAKLDRHLAECARCAVVASEAHEVSRRLGLVLVPLTLGAAGAGGYLAALQEGAITTIALMPMPATVLPGAGLASPASAAATASATGAATAGASSAAGAAGAAGAASASAAAAAAGAAAGAGAPGIAGALVVVGAVVAAAVGLPATEPVMDARPVTAVSQTDASAPAPLTPLAVVEAGSMTVARGDGPGPADVAAPPADADEGRWAERAASRGDGRQDAANTNRGGNGIADARGNGNAGANGNAGGNGNPGGNGNANPGANGNAGPNANAGANADPNAGRGPHPPGNANGQSGPPAGAGSGPGGGASPGTGSANRGDSGPGAAADAGGSVALAAPAIVSSASSQSGAQTTVALTIAATAGTTVQARIRGVVHDTGTVDGSGVALLTLSPSAQELAVDARVELRYADGSAPGGPVGARLSDLM